MRRRGPPGQHGRGEHIGWFRCRARGWPAPDPRGPSDGGTVTAAVGLPTLVLTAALVVVVCFWLLVAVGVARAGAFDTDVDLRRWRVDGVPVSVALSLLTLCARCASVGAGVLMALALPPGGTGLPRLLVLFAAPFAALPATRLLVRRLDRLRPAGPAPEDAGGREADPRPVVAPGPRYQPGRARRPKSSPRGSGGGGVPRRSGQAISMPARKPTTWATYATVPAAETAPPDE